MAGLQADRGQKEIKLEMQLGLIGLGKMGGNLALQALEKKIDVIGKARSKKPELEEKGVKVTTDYSPFVKPSETSKSYLSISACRLHCRYSNGRADSPP